MILRLSSLDEQMDRRTDGFINGQIHKHINGKSLHSTGLSSLSRLLFKMKETRKENTKQDRNIEKERKEKIIKKEAKRSNLFCPTSICRCRGSVGLTTMV